MNILKKAINRNENIRNLFYHFAMKMIVRPYVSCLKVPVMAITGTNGKTTEL
jgi:UDP-N-acetylmuramoylalanine-D-glutamate ligase